MNHYIAYGAGVGSTALVNSKIKDIKNGMEVVFVDHGGDYPRTYEYIPKIEQELDIDVTILKPEEDLYDYCFKRQLLPSIHWRWCTDKFKIQPMKRYVDGDIPLIGLTKEESWRGKDFQIKGKAEYPLININKQEAQKLICGQIPGKSGCFFCPFQKKEQWIKLYHEYPELYTKAQLLEENAQKRNKNIWLYKKGLRQLRKEIETQTSLLLWLNENKSYK